MDVDLIGHDVRFFTGERLAEPGSTPRVYFIAMDVPSDVFRRWIVVASALNCASRSGLR